MKSPPRLRFEPRPSRWGWLVLIFACASVAVLVTPLELPLGAIVACVAAIAATLGVGYLRFVGRGVPVFMLIGTDRRITVGDVAGAVREGAILDDSYVSDWLTSIVWAVDGEPWWRPARVILVVPGMLASGDFRALRVAMRYGRAAGDINASDAA